MTHGELVLALIVTGKLVTGCGYRFGSMSMTSNMTSGVVLPLWPLTMIQEFESSIETLKLVES